MAEIGILNVGTGDTKLVFDPNNPEDVTRASKTIADMLKRGYAILVEVAKDDKGEALYRRVREFKVDTFEYIIAGDPPDLTENMNGQQSSTSAGRQNKRSSNTRCISAGRSSGIAIAPTAGG